MRRQTLLKSVGWMLGAGMLFLACGPGAMQTPQDGTPPTETSTPDGRVQAMAPPDSCDESVDIGWCRVFSDKVQCNSGIQMFAHSTPDGWCIPRDVCKNHGGPIVCPE